MEGSEDAPDVQGDGRCGSLPLGVERPDWCRTALYNLLRSTMEVLGSGGVVHWLEFGTLLGAVRERDVIAHTNDVEVASLLSRALPVLPRALRASLSCLGPTVVCREAGDSESGAGVRGPQPQPQ